MPVQQISPALSVFLYAIQVSPAILIISWAFFFFQSLVWNWEKEPHDNACWPSYIPSSKQPKGLDLMHALSFEKNCLTHLPPWPHTPSHTHTTAISPLPYIHVIGWVSFPASASAAAGSHSFPLHRAMLPSIPPIITGHGKNAIRKRFYVCVTLVSCLSYMLLHCHQRHSTSLF